MKHLTITILLVIGSCLNLIAEKLPQHPWEVITHIIQEGKENISLRHHGETTIKLYGEYSTEDSLMVDQAIKTLNTLCETLQLKTTKKDEASINLLFISSELKTLDKRRDILMEYRPDSTIKKVIKKSSLILNIEDITGDKKQNYITNNLAFCIFPNWIHSTYNTRKGRTFRDDPESIYRWPTSRIIDYDYTNPLSQFDKEIVQAVFSKDFLQNLKHARKQFNTIPSWITNNSKLVLIIPFILLLIAITMSLNVYYKRRGHRIKRDFARFNIFASIALASTTTVGSLFYVLMKHIESPAYSFYNYYDVILAILAITVVTLIAANIIRVIEKAILKTTDNSSIKVLLIFISTTLTPTLALVTIYTTIDHDIPYHYASNIVFIIILIFFIIGIFRAIISLFLFKEKDATIANNKQLAELKELKTKAELNALHSKINPHFLYNSLNSIAGLAHTSADKTEQMALSLSKLFRYSINKEQSDWTTLKEEIEMAKIYLDIEKMRFDDRLTFIIDIPTELRKKRIPRFIIQPLVENAVKHGISNRVEKGEIEVSIKKEGHEINLSISDNGQAFPEHINPGFGLQGIYDKLEIFYPQRFEVHFQNTPKKTIIIKLMSHE